MICGMQPPSWTCPTFTPSRDKGHARRLMAILLLHEGRTITDVHHLTGAARSTIGRWLRWYRDEGIDALEALPAGRAPVLPIAKIVTLLVLLMQFSPQDFGYQRSRWCTELLAIKINRLTGLNVAASTLRRWLPRMGIVWRRPVPTLRIKDPAYQEKMANIDAGLRVPHDAGPTRARARRPIWHG